MTMDQTMYATETLHSSVLSSTFAVETAQGAKGSVTIDHPAGAPYFLARTMQECIIRNGEIRVAVRHMADGSQMFTDFDTYIPVSAVTIVWEN